MKPGPYDLCSCGSGKKSKFCGCAKPLPQSAQASGKGKTPPADQGAALAGLMQQGLQAHQAGRLADANAIYRRVITANPQHADALHLLGVLAYQMGQFAPAAELIRRAIAVNPGVPEYHANLGHALKDAGDFPAAEASYRKALHGHPRRPEALNNLGLVLQAQARMDEARAAFEQAIALEPGFIFALMNMGALEHAQNDLAAAESWYRRALALNPGFAQGWNNLGTVLQARGGLAEARTHYERALELQPGYGDALSNLGAVLELQGEFKDAAHAYQRAIALGGRFDDVRLNLGALLRRGGEYAEAIRHFSAVLAREPTHARAHLNLGVVRQDEGRMSEALAHYLIAQAQALPSTELANNIASVLAGLGRLECALTLLQGAYPEGVESKQTLVNMGSNLFAQGRLEQALAAFEKVLALEPGHVNARWNVAMLQLAMARFPEMWEAYEWRLQRELSMFGKPARPFTYPMWTGRRLAPGSVLLIYPEQGVGDELWAAGMYADVLDGQASEARVVIECRPKLLTLFKRSFAGAEVVPWTDPPNSQCLESVDWQIAGGSLGQFTRRSLADFPKRERTAGGYLTADAVRKAYWQRRIAELGPGLKVGICWRSSNIRGERALSCTRLTQWQGIFSASGVHFVNLQYDECEAELAEAESAFGVNIRRFPEVDMYDDLDETAALICGLDLVISAPTSVSIMSAALGIATWQMDYGSLGQLHGLPNNPWYPAMRNYVRRWDQSWAEIIARIAHDLAALSGATVAEGAIPANTGVSQASEAAFSRVLRLARNGELETARALLQPLLTDDVAGAAASIMLSVTAPQEPGHASLERRLERAAAAVANSLNEFLLDLGNAFRLSGLAAKASPLLQAATRIDPENPAGWEALGMAARANGEHALAVSALERAVLCDPTAGFLKLLLAETLDGLAMQHIAAAANNQACALLERAAALQPRSAEIQFHFGCTLQEAERYDEATAAYRRTIEFQPGFAPAWNNLANTLRACRRLDESIECFRRALAIDDSLTGVRSNLLLTMNYAEGVDPQAFFEEHLEFGRRVSSGVAVVPAVRRNDAGRRLRIGYVSADFRAHPITRFLEPIVAHHDRSEFEIFCYASSTRSDAVTEKIRARVDGWRVLAGLNDEDAAKCIRDDAIDVLIDLSGHTAMNRLPVFARKPAPVQASYLGYPATSGLQAMDYKIVDSLTAPEGEGLEAMHTEMLWRLDGPMWAFSPDTGAVAVSAPPAERNGVITFGSFNSVIKVGSTAIRTWARILREVAGSRLVLATVPQGETRARLTSEFAEHGIEASRLVYHARLAPAEFWELYATVDIALDSFPCNGGTTTFETLWMGVPVLALAGAANDILVSRVSAGILHGLDLAELVASDHTDYVRRAVALAQDRPRLFALRRELRQRLSGSAYMRHQEFVRDLEQAYHAMWQRRPLKQLEAAR